MLTKIARKSELLKLASWLGIGTVLRTAYRFLFAPQGGEHEVCVAGRHAKFHVYSTAAAQALDSLGGERPMLEFLMSRLGPGDCFYDVGAATGLYTVFLALVVGENGHVFAFEPQRDPYERLGENVKLNELPNVRTFQIALSDHDGTATLEFGDVAGEGRIVDPATGSRRDQEKVEIVQGDKFTKRQNLTPPTAVKIDVEGHEYSVLKGLDETLSLPDCKLICCEVHPRFLPAELCAEDLLALLRSRGFTEVQTNQRGPDLHVWAQKPKRAVSRPFRINSYSCEA